MRTRNVNGVHAPTAAYATGRPAFRPGGGATAQPDALAEPPEETPATLASALRDLAVFFNALFLTLAVVLFALVLVFVAPLTVFVLPLLLVPGVNIAAMWRAKGEIWANASAALVNLAWLGLLWAWALDGLSLDDALWLGALLGPQEMALAVQLVMLYAQVRQRIERGVGKPSADLYRVERSFPAFLTLAAALLVAGFVACFPWRSQYSIQLSMAARFDARAAKNIARIDCSLSGETRLFGRTLECRYESPRKEVVRDVMVDVPRWLGSRVAAVLYVRSGSAYFDLARAGRSSLDASTLDAFFLAVLAERILDQQP